MVSRAIFRPLINQVAQPMRPVETGAPEPSYHISDSKNNNGNSIHDDKSAAICQSAYVPSELFTFCDKRGLIQDENNLPFLYHIKRHCTDKAINIDPESANQNSFSTVLPEVDKRDTHRLSKAYWWLKYDAKYIDEIRKRLLWKKQHPNQSFNLAFNPLRHIAQVNIAGLAMQVLLSHQEPLVPDATVASR
ncbi:hypothetical protein M0802_010756 [Mischocyttarus mexicanus]|nr:hypothetical protein M0802_010756 [Mischocyttarus mexicanus]